MHSARPFRPEMFRVPAGDFGETKTMRSIILHFEPGTTNVDGFACSSCDWFFVFTSSEADGTLPRREVDHAHERFAEHKCSEYPKVSAWVDEP
jgi:hypothetical protein